MMTTPGVRASRFDRPARTVGHATTRFPVRALSADAALLRRLTALPRRGRVHSVFERVVNVDAGGGRLVSLAHRASDDAPDTVVVDLDSWAALGLSPGIEVRLASSRIVLANGCVISLDPARPWHGRLPAYAADDAVLRANLAAARDEVGRHGKGIGLGRSGGAALTGIDLAAATAFEHGTRGLCAAIARDDESLAFEHVGRLVGLGPGLTPSGDDFLLGLLAALNIPDGPCEAWRRVGAHVVECAAGQTHLISAAALRHAANARVRASVVGLCDALMNQPSAAMRQALDRVLRIGSGSGSEIALGVLAGFGLHLAAARGRETPQAQHDTAGAAHGW